MFGIKAVLSKPNRSAPAQVRKAVNEALKQTALEAKAKMLEPTSTWKHNVDFVIEGPKTRGNDTFIIVYTEDKPYVYTNRGQPVRHMRLPKGFMPKTKPNSFVAMSGSGHYGVVDPKFSGPPVEPRNWTKMTASIFTRRLLETLREKMKYVKFNADVASSYSKNYRGE